MDVRQDKKGLRWLERGLSLGETALYGLIGVVLLISGIVMVYDAVVNSAAEFVQGDLVAAATHGLDRLLLALMAVEILYTVRISLKSHALACEPFLVVGLIASVRRILILTLETAQLSHFTPEKFRASMIETGVLTVLILVLVVSIILLRKTGRELHERTSGEG